MYSIVYLPYTRLQYVVVIQSPSHVQLCNSMDCSPPGSSVHRVPQASILEWVDVSSSRGSTWPRDWTLTSCTSCLGRCTLYHWASSEASANVKEMHIKTTRTCNPTPVRMAIIKSTQITNVGRDVKKKVPSDNVGGNVNWCSHWGKQYRGLSKNYKQHHNMTQQFHSWVYTGKKKTTTLIQNDTCTPVSIAA